MTWHLTSDVETFAATAGTFLFIGLANPAGNALYPRLGYRSTEDRAVVEFSS
ncbi:putative GNAT family acetyltransferase [Actinoplanes campanulatus]|uniref:Putative GNAT family acetyltransferase n=1 Tax=Actinoplanes campanulatus TaxID=113559 RepID=A0A7W5FGB6_9ACTN|nr:hypothetical protein [Actinoplanes campanulatus]MBB3097374.1 putative GNAT family acetyltransferase [Actinoplanes campanulatus]GGN26548.1 hypothetical protein GCM10010109_43430 [Actinoplanes campanulatus]GID38164.1 hypothetical protein Aca09nite_46700 [Actinoplanes campanulatus]